MTLLCDTIRVMRFRCEIHIEKYLRYNSIINIIQMNRSEIKLTINVKCFTVIKKNKQTLDQLLNETICLTLFLAVQKINRCFSSSSSSFVRWHLILKRTNIHHKFVLLNVRLVQCFFFPLNLWCDVLFVCVCVSNVDFMHSVEM